MNRSAATARSLPDPSGAPPPAHRAQPAEIDRLVDFHYLAASRAACRYVQTLAAGVLDTLGFHGAAEPAPPTAIGGRLGVVPDRAYALAWLLWEAAEIRAVDRVVDDSGAVLYRPRGEPPRSDRRRRAAAALAGHAARVGCSHSMLDFVAGEYPAFLRGEKSGLYILLRGRGLELWEGYFSATNPLYDVHNRIGALGLAAALARLGRPAAVVELGTGAGGGTAALLDRLAGAGLPRPASFTLTDLAPSFLVRTLERLAPGAAAAGLELARRRLDFDRPLAEQGIEPGSVDVLVGVNALHNGSRPAVTLGHLAEALSPDGLVVISESICGSATHVHQAFVFNLQPPTRPVDPDEGTYTRFFSTAGWRCRLDAAPLVAEIYRNSHGPELALLALARRLAA
jgi:SAM-dependent methyltransferase